MRSPGVTVAALLGAWLVVVAPLAWAMPWLYDDRILLVNGHLAPAAGALRIAWTGDYWRLAADGQQVLAGLYRPVLATSFVVEQLLVGMNPGAAHVVNALLLAGTAALVAVWARQRGATPWIAAALVVVSPLTGELVGVVTNRGDLLAALFVVGSLVARRADWLGLAAILVALGALSKEVALVAPLLWVIDGERSGRRLVAAVVPVALVLALRSVFLGAPPFAGLHPVDALVATGQAMLTLVAPIPSGPIPSPRPAWPAVLVLVAAALLARRAPFGPLWVLVAFAPMAGWLGLPTRAADGVLLLPLLGVAVGVAGFRGRRPGALVAGLVAFLFVLQLATLRQHRDPGAFWTWATRTNPASALAWSNLGASVAPTDGPRAGAAYDEAIRLSRRTGDVSELARALQGRGWVALLGKDTATARRCFDEAIARVGADRAPMAVKGLAALRRAP